MDASPAAPARTGTRGLGSRWRASLRLARRQTLRAWASSLLVVALIALPMAFVAGVLVYADGRQPTTAERIDAELGAAAAWVAVVNGPDPSLTQYDDQPLSIEIDRNPRTGEPTHEQQPLPGSAAPSLAGRDAIEIGVGSATVRTASGIAPVRAVIGDAGADVLRGRFLLREGRAAAGPREAMVSPGALERLGVAIGDTVTLTEPEGQLHDQRGALARRGSGCRRRDLPPGDRADPRPPDRRAADALVAAHVASGPERHLPAERGGDGRVRPRPRREPRGRARGAAPPRLCCVVVKALRRCAPGEDGCHGAQ
ncbi:hypothetical protein [Microbacterium lacticum]